MQPRNQASVLDAWFLKDAKGQSCASCHSPDGIELRGFDADDIRRRIARHHDVSVSDKIVRILQDDSPRKVGANIETRPMQPGNEILSGKSPAERDGQFLARLKADRPYLFVNINSFEQAKQFQKHILEINLEQMPVGIAMNRLSEDGVHGVEHETVANWFADVPVFDSSEIQTESMAYLTQPTDENLEKIDAKVVKISKANDPFALLSLAKYRSMLVYQHELRTGRPTAILPKGNPFWQVAEFGRIYAETDAQMIRAPKEIAEAKNFAKTLKAQAKQLRLPWYWLGWIRDPALVKSGAIRETLRGDYFCQYLEEDGPYMGHMALMLTRKMAEQKPVPAWEIQYSFFLANRPLANREPSDPKARTLFRQLVRNSLTMSLFLLEQDLLERKKTIRKVPQLNQIKLLTPYAKLIGGPSTALISRVSKRLEATPEF
jgi:hypothetical protein